MAKTDPSASMRITIGLSLAVALLILVLLVFALILGGGVCWACGA